MRHPGGWLGGRVAALVGALPVTVVVIAVASCGPASGAGDRSAMRCGPARARTLAADSLVRVFQTGAGVYGCSAKTGLRTKLGPVGPCFEDNQLVAPVAVAGELVAYGLESCGVDTESAQVVVRRLSDGRVLLNDAASTSVFFNPVSDVSPRAANSPSLVGGCDLGQGTDGAICVSSLVLAHGGVAWISVLILPDGARDTMKVHRVDRRGKQILDTSPKIAPGSLRLRGSRLSWKHGSFVRVATLL